MNGLVRELIDLIGVAADQAAEAEDDIELGHWRAWKGAHVEQVDEHRLRLKVGSRIYRVDIAEEESWS